MYMGLAVALLAAMAAQADEVSVTVETGRAGMIYNTVQIPNDATGTRFSLTNDFTAHRTDYWRGEITDQINPKQSYALVAAPFVAKSTGVSTFPINFDGTTFPTGTAIDATYRFDTYRLRYRYTYNPGAKLERGLGWTILVRDAAIALEGGGLRAEDANIGVVPLLNFGLKWNVDDKTAVVFDGDALIGPGGGRAEDVILAVQHGVSDKVDVYAGYRIIEGGADNEQVYNFARIDFIGAGVVVRF
jgi:hypothetical protein